MKKLFIRISIFSILTICVLIIIDPYFLRNQYGDQASFNSFYNAGSNEVDILLIGNSHLHRGVDPYIMEAKIKANTEIIVGGGSTISQVYFNLLEALEYQTPKIVVIETWPLVVPNYQNNDLFDKKGRVLVNRHGTEYFKRFGIIKLQEILITHTKKTWYHIFNAIRFHDFWQEPEIFRQSFIAMIENKPKELFHNSIIHRNTYLTKKQIIEFQNMDFKENEMLISEKEQLYIDKIIKLSKKNSFELLFITIPVYDLYYQKVKNGFKRVNNQILKIIKKHQNVKYFDINGKYNGFNYSNIVREKKVSINQHLNYKGGIISSNELANFIKNNYKEIFNNKNIKNTFEYNLYNTKEIKENPNFTAEVTKIINVSNSNELIIEGWMHLKGVNNWKVSKDLALKKNEDFIFISSNQLKTKTNNKIIDSLGKNYKSSGYIFKLSKTLLDKGKYDVYNLIKTDKGEIFTKNSNKKIIIN